MLHNLLLLFKIVSSCSCSSSRNYILSCHLKLHSELFGLSWTMGSSSMRQGAVVLFVRAWDVLFSGVHWCLIWCSLFAFQCIIWAMECGKNVWLVYLIPGSMHHSCSGRLGQCPGWRPWRSDRDFMCINHPFMVPFMFVLKNEYNNFWIYKWERCGSRCGQNKLWYLAYHIVMGVFCIWGLLFHLSLRTIRLFSSCYPHMTW